MFGLGWAEIIVLGIIAVLLFGRKLPDMAKYLGKSVVEFKKGYLEKIPLPDRSVNLITSNCVINPAHAAPHGRCPGRSHTTFPSGEVLLISRSARFALQVLLSLHYH